MENLPLAPIPGHAANRANTPWQPQVIGSSNICSIVYGVSRVRACCSCAMDGADFPNGKKTARLRVSQMKK